MKAKVLFLVAGLLLLAALTACQAVQPVAAQPASILVTASAFMQASNLPGRVLVSARGNHFIVSSAPPLGHSSEEINPVEAMLAALGTCGLFIHEAASIEQDIPLDHAAAVVAADWDVRGLLGEDVNPKMQQIRVHLTLDGPDAAQAASLGEEFISRCPIYTTLVRAAEIVITTNEEEMGGKIDEGLATSVISATLSNEAGRAIVGVRHNVMVVDSVPPLGSPSEEVNSLDLFLAAPGTCGVVAMEYVARNEGLPLAGVGVSVEADLDPRGVRGGDVSPRIQAMRVHFQIAGVDEATAQMLVDEWLSRCPLYNTYIEATEIEVTHEVVDAIALPQ